MTDAPTSLVGGAPRAVPSSLPQATPYCTNCKAKLAGRYCCDCGQDSIPEETAAASWRSQWHRLVRTLHALLLRPGLLTQEHLCGGRIRYIPPFTLFLNVVAVFFLLSIVTDFRVKTFVEKDSTRHLEHSIERRAAEAGVTRDVYLDRIERRFQGVYTLCLASISLLGYTLLMKLVYRRGWIGWRGPFTLALHWLAFVFIMLPAIMALSRLAAGAMPALPLRATAIALSLAASLTWLSLAARRLFAEAWPWALAKAACILVVGFVIDQAMFLSAMLLAFNLA